MDVFAIRRGAPPPFTPRGAAFGGRTAERDSASSKPPKAELPLRVPFDEWPDRGGAGEAERPCSFVKVRLIDRGTPAGQGGLQGRSFR